MVGKIHSTHIILMYRDKFCFSRGLQEAEESELHVRLSGKCELFAKQILEVRKTCRIIKNCKIPNS